MTPIRTTRDIYPSADTRHPWGVMDAIFAGGERFRGTIEPQFVAGGNTSATLPVDSDGCFATRLGRHYILSDQIPPHYYGDGAEAAGIDTRAITITKLMT